MGVNTDREQVYFDKWDEGALRTIIEQQKKITRTSKQLGLKKLYQVLVVIDDYADQPETAPWTRSSSAGATCRSAPGSPRRSCGSSAPPSTSTCSSSASGGSGTNCCTPLPLPRYHRSPPAGVGFSAPLPAPVLRPASLYAIYPSNRLAQAACPKALQASGSELNLADLSAAHGASQMHSQTLAKHPVLPKVASNGFGSTQPLGQALRPPLAGLASAQPGAVLQETLRAQAWDSILLLWHSLCEFIAPLSQVVQELATSVNRRALTLKLLQVNSDTTVSRYVSSCLSFFSFVADLGLDLSALTQVL